MRIAVAVPCYKVTQHVLGVIAAIGPEVDTVYAVDDACPDGSGRFIEEHNRDPRVRVLYNPQNRGVAAPSSRPTRRPLRTAWTSW